MSPTSTFLQNRVRLTRDEHETRAMLLGLWFDHEDHTYNGRTAAGRQFLDADTLEVIYLHVADRLKEVKDIRAAGYDFCSDD